MSKEAIETVTLTRAQMNAVLKAAYPLATDEEREAVLKSAMLSPSPLPIAVEGKVEPYQDRVAAAHHALFHDDPTDVPERLARFMEEANETCQAFGMTRDEAHQLVDYTYDRPAGEPAKEIGAAMLTLTSLCVVAGYDLMKCAEADLEKLQRPETITRIRAKRSTRHGRGPLPGFDPSSPGKDGGQEVEAVKGVDPQVIVAASEMNATQKRQPEWLWYNHNSEKRSFGRWASYDDQAPYIRGDLATVSIVGEATRYAESLARSLHSKHYSEVTEWSPLSGDLIGILSQIDNMIAGLSSPQTASTALVERLTKAAGAIANNQLLTGEALAELIAAYRALSSTKPEEVER